MNRGGEPNNTCDASTTWFYTRESGQGMQCATIARLTKMALSEGECKSTKTEYTGGRKLEQLRAFAEKVSGP